MFGSVQLYSECDWFGSFYVEDENWLPVRVILNGDYLVFLHRLLNASLLFKLRFYIHVNFVPVLVLTCVGLAVLIFLLSFL